MMSLDQFEYRQREHARETSKVNCTAWMLEDLIIPPALGKRIRDRVRRR